MTRSCGLLREKRRVVRAGTSTLARCPTCATLDELFKKQPRMGRGRSCRQDPEFFAKLSRQQSPQLPVDRLRRQPRAGQPDRRLAAGRDLRPSQHRQHGGAHRPELPVGHAVRGRHPQGQAHHRRRPLRLQRRAGGVARRARRSRRQLAAARAGRAREARARAACDCASEGAAARPALRAERHRAGAERLPDHASCATRGSAARSCTCTAGSTASPTAWCATWAPRSPTSAKPRPHTRRRWPSSPKPRRESVMFAATAASRTPG